MKIVVVLEHPQDLYGRAEKEFSRYWQEAGLPEPEYVNLISEAPATDDGPSKEQLAAEKNRVADALKDAPFIVTLGPVATKNVFKKVGMSLAHGTVLTLTDNRKGMPLWHPAYIIRDPSKAPMFQADLARFAREYEGVPNDGKVVWEIVNKDSIDEFIQEFTEAKEFSFDFETSGLDYWRPGFYATCFGIGLHHKTWIIPLTIGGSPFINFEAQKKLFELLSDIAKDKYGIGQNGKFDNEVMYSLYGVTFPLNFDTMLAHYVIDENSPHDLEFLAKIYLDAPSYDLPLKVKHGKAGRYMELFEYLAKDCSYTLKLRKILLKQLKQDKASKMLFDKLIMPASHALFKVERNGLYVNQDRMNEVAEQVAKDLNVTLSQLNKLVGRNVNWSSPDQVSKVLFDDLGLKPTVLTPKGKPSTGEAALADLKDKHPVPNLLVKYRELEKFRGTYVEGWRELMHDGRLYFSYKIHGTVTGRWSSRLHQTPRDGTIRNIVSAPPGWTFVQGDFSQAELRTVAEVSGDPELTRCFVEDIDVHWSTLLYTIRAGGAGEYVKPAIDTACRLIKENHPERKVIKPGLPIALEWLEKAGHEKCIELWKGWKEARKKAKGINFGFVYGMRENKFVEYAKLRYGFEPTFEEAHAIREAYFSLYRGLKPWHDRSIKLVHLNGEVRNLIGRARHLPTVHSPDRSLRMEAERQAINSPIQGFIGDMKAMAFVELVETLDPNQAIVVGEVHDSILFWVKTESLEAELAGKDSPKVMQQILRTMENPRILKELGVELTVPIVCDLEYGDWGKGTKIEREKIEYK